jgi:hypothetical protein
MQNTSQRRVLRICTSHQSVSVDGMGTYGDNDLHCILTGNLELEQMDHEQIRKPRGEYEVLPSSRVCHGQNENEFATAQQDSGPVHRQQSLSEPHCALD